MEGQRQRMSLLRHLGMGTVGVTSIELKPESPCRTFAEIEPSITVVGVAVNSGLALGSKVGEKVGTSVGSGLAAGAAVDGIGVGKAVGVAVEGINDG
jgi:hypothetical protein